MRWAAKRDANEPGIVKALERAGWLVMKVSDKGAPDLLCARKGRLVLVEVKGPKGKLTPAQVESHARLAASGVTVHVVTTPEEALMAVGAPVEGVLEPEMHRLMSPSPGHVVTPAYRRAQTDAVVPRRRPVSPFGDGPSPPSPAGPNGLGLANPVREPRRRKPTPPPSVPPLKEVAEACRNVDKKSGDFEEPPDRPNYEEDES